MSFSRSVFCSTLSFLIFTTTFGSSVTKSFPVVSSTTISLPKEINTIIAQFNRVKSPENLAIKNKGWINRYIFNGPSGTGKTTDVQEIARQTNSEVISIRASDLVNAYQGSGAQLIRDTLKRARDLTNRGKSVIVFIDEIDNIASKNVASNRQDTHSAKQTLWCELLDPKNANNNRLLILMATNVKEQLNKTFYSRFSPQTIVEFKLPDVKEREQIVQTLFASRHMPELNEESLTMLLSSVEESVRKEHYQFFQNCITSLGDIKEKLCNFSAGQDETKISELRTLIKNLRASKNEFLDQKLMSAYFESIDPYLDQVEVCLTRKVALFPASILDALVKETDGLSHRDLMHIMTALVGAFIVDETNDTVFINQEKLFDFVNKLKANRAEIEQSWSEEDRQKAHDLQTKFNLYTAYNEKVKKCLTTDCIKNIRHNPTYTKLRKELFPPQKNSLQKETSARAGTINEPKMSDIDETIFDDFQLLQHGKTIQGNQRLILGSDSERRALAKDYASAGNGLFKEFDAAEIISGYLSEGSRSFSHLLNDIFDEAEQSDRKLIVIYVSNINQITEIVESCSGGAGSASYSYNFNFAKERAALEQFVLESGQCKSDSDQHLIFIFGPPKHNADIITDKLNGEEISLPKHGNREIFLQYFLGNDKTHHIQNMIFDLLSKLEKNQNLSLNLYMQEANEIKTLKKAWRQLDKSFWTENDWWPNGPTFMSDTTKLEKTKKEAIESCKKISQLCKPLSEKWVIEQSKALSEDEKTYCLLQSQYYKNLEIYFSTYIQIYEKPNEHKMHYDHALTKSVVMNNGKVLGKN